MAVPARVIERQRRWRCWARRWGLALLSLGAGAIVYAFYSQAAAVWALQDQLQLLQAQAAQLEEDNLKLAERLSLRDDPGYLEYLARQELGLVRPGEVKFILPPELP